MQLNTTQNTPPTPEMNQSIHPRRRKRARYIIFPIVVIVVCFLAGFLGGTVADMVRTYGDSFNIGAANDGNQVITKQEADVSDVVKKVSPSVVSVITSSTQTSQFYGPQEMQGAGTGIIVGKDGYVLTNKHVVAGSSTVSVVLSDGTSYQDVKVVGTDPLNDLAFLKIPDVSDLPTAELGDSKSIRIGQNVIAIGNALGQYQNTVTSGIISGTGRPVTAGIGGEGGSTESLSDLIQTDAAINSGNSGGPLLNLQGQVIGINTAVAQDAQGIGFAIPIAAAKGMLKGVLAGGGVQHSYIGVNYVSITPEVEKEYKLSVKHGAYIIADNGKSAVIKGGPADKAGLKQKDIITKVNGAEVGDSGSISSLVAEYGPGDTIQLNVVRDGKELTLKVTLKAYKA